eukprot:848363-Pelagomonas_calceolata.AAC.1
MMHGKEPSHHKSLVLCTHQTTQCCGAMSSKSRFTSTPTAGACSRKAACRALAANRPSQNSVVKRSGGGDNARPIRESCSKELQPE